MAGKVEGWVYDDLTGVVCTYEGLQCVCAAWYGDEVRHHGLMEGRTWYYGNESNRRSLTGSMAGKGWVGQASSLLTWSSKGDMFASMGHEWSRKIMVSGNGSTVCFAKSLSLLLAFLAQGNFRARANSGRLVGKRTVLERERIRIRNTHVNDFCSINQAIM